jgi:hypothetical protein
MPHDVAATVLAVVASMCSLINSPAEAQVRDRNAMAQWSCLRGALRPR